MFLNLLSGGNFESILSHADTEDREFILTYMRDLFHLDHSLRPSSKEIKEKLKNASIKRSQSLSMSTIINPKNIKTKRSRSPSMSSITNPKNTKILATSDESSQAELQNTLEVPTTVAHAMNLVTSTSYLDVITALTLL